MLATNGSVDTIPGPNNSTQAGRNDNAAGDSDLSAITGGPTYDACVLEFDMTVPGDSIGFNYVFGSEEYPEYVFEDYNDVFAFFISGPGIARQNIALIPGTSEAVSIHAVNVDSMNRYFVYNGNGITTPYDTGKYYIQYNGFTTVLTARIGGLQKCQTYHLKLAIADGVDGLVDSGVFLQAQSLQTDIALFDSVSSSIPNINYAVKGCTDGVFNFRLPNPQPVPVTVHYYIGGNAQNGIDYAAIPDSIIIPPGDTTYQLQIIPTSNAEYGYRRSNIKPLHRLRKHCSVRYRHIIAGRPYTDERFHHPGNVQWHTGAITGFALPKLHVGATHRVIGYRYF